MSFPVELCIFNEAVYVPIVGYVTVGFCNDEKTEFDPVSVQFQELILLPKLLSINFTGCPTQTEVVVVRKSAIGAPLRQASDL